MRIFFEIINIRVLPKSDNVQVQRRLMGGKRRFRLPEETLYNEPCLLGNDFK